MEIIYIYLSFVDNFLFVKHCRFNEKNKLYLRPNNMSVFIDI